MNTDRFIYSQEYIQARIYSYIKFKKYMKDIADIFCEEFYLDKSQVLGIDLSSANTLTISLIKNGFEKKVFDVLISNLQSKY